MELNDIIILFLIITVIILIACKMRILITQTKLKECFFV